MCICSVHVHRLQGDKLDDSMTVHIANANNAYKRQMTSRKIHFNAISCIQYAEYSSVSHSQHGMIKLMSDRRKSAKKTDDKEKEGRRDEQQHYAHVLQRRKTRRGMRKRSERKKRGSEHIQNCVAN